MRPDPRAREGADQARPRRLCAAPAQGLALALLATLVLQPGCSGTDPIEQARIIAGRAPTATLPPVPGAGEPYPDLGTVPPRPQTTPPAARQALAEALVADRANARYIGQPAAPAVPRGEAAAVPPAPATLPAAAPMLLGAREEELPLVPPPPPPPPIAGAPRAAPETRAAASPLPQVLGVAQAQPPTATPPAGPSPPAGGVERAPIAPIAVEQLPPPPAPAMPDELPARAREPQAAAGGPAAPVRTPSPDPTPVALPAEPRGAPAAGLAASPAPPGGARASPAPPPQPVQPSVIVDRTALAPQARRSPPETGYALAFLPGTATIAASDLAVLGRLAGRGGATFQVTGYADDAASGRALDLPLARARAVADALRAAGVPAERIELGGSARPGPAGRGAEVRLVYTR